MGFILSEALDRYVEAHTTSQDQLLQELDRETHLHFNLPQMLSGTVQGRFLSMVTSMLRPGRVLEIGTFTGYSAICMARNLAPGGKLTTIDIDPELEDTVRRYFSRAKLDGVIDFRIGNALEIIPELEGPFDLVFLDADKENYSKYYDLVFPEVRKGGFILADNVLWSGKVIEDEMDGETRALVDYSAMVQNDDRVENVLLSVRDGIMLAKKLSD